MDLREYVDNDQRLIGLTGGIGSGKSTVTGFLEKRGYTVIDTDQISRDITGPGGSAVGRLEKALGSGVVSPDGSLNRKKTSDIVFENREKLKLLEDITHEEIYAIICSRVAGTDEEVIFVDAPLMFETRLYKDMDEIWLVTADIDMRAERVSARDGIPLSDVRKRMSVQMDDGEKKKRADHIIDNSGSLNSLYARVEELLKAYEEKDNSNSDNACFHNDRSHVPFRLRKQRKIGRRH